MGMKAVVAQMQHYHNLQFGDLEWEWRQLTLHNLQFGDLEWEWRQLKLKCNTTTTYSLVTWNGNEDSCSSNATLPHLTVWWLGMGMKTVVAQMQHYHTLQFGDLEWEWRQL